MPDALFEALRAQLDEAQLMELTATAAVKRKSVVAVYVIGLFIVTPLVVLLIV